MNLDKLSWRPKGDFDATPYPSWIWINHRIFLFLTESTEKNLKREKMIIESI
jgi:hypothetical protein